MFKYLYVNDINNNVSRTLPPDIKAAKEFGEEEFVTPKKNLASALPSIKLSPSFSLLLHLVFGKRPQSKSLVHVPIKYVSVSMMVGN